MSTYRVWQVRRNGQVTGPFPENLIIQHILVGRIRHDDQISMDGHFWQSVESTPEILDQLRQMREAEGDPEWREERLRAILRHVDERKRPDPRSRETPEEAAIWAAHRAGGDRRVAPETVEQHSYRETLAEVDQWLSSHRPGRNLMSILVAALLVSAGVMLYYFGSSEPRIDLGLRAAACEQQPARQVDWHGCDKSGYVLVGADLREANLNGVNFSGANLNYANLKGARIEGVLLGGANLAGTTWLDGRVCAAESVGVCR